MVKATHKDKKIAVDILSDSFAGNKSVLSITGGKNKRIRALMEYAFKTCITQGYVYLSDDLKACALIMLPDKKKNDAKSFWNDLVFCVKGLGILNVGNAIKREKLIRLKQKDPHVYYLWFIGVPKKHQRLGSGSMLMSSILKDAAIKNRRLVLETSTLENIAWYKKFGLKEYDHLDLGYRLSFFTSLLR